MGGTENWLLLAGHWRGGGGASVLGRGLDPEAVNHLVEGRRAQLEQPGGAPLNTAGQLEGLTNEVLLVLDATTGQNGLSQAKLFTEAVGVTGIVLTKLDGTARGGIVLAIHKELGIPVQWVGLGEGLEDIEPFDAGRFSKGLFGE